MVGKAEKPRAFVGLNIERDLPVVYYYSKKAWFNSAIFSDWFSNHFVPGGRIYQKVLRFLRTRYAQFLFSTMLLRIAVRISFPEEMEKLRCSSCFPTRLRFCTMDQGVISAIKRHYIRRYLDAVLVVIEDGLVDNRGERTLANMIRYNIRSAIFNFTAAWQDLRPSVLANSWKKLLKCENTETNFEGLEAVNFLHMLARVRRSSNFHC